MNLLGGILGDSTTTGAASGAAGAASTASSSGLNDFMSGLIKGDTPQFGDTLNQFGAGNSDQTTQMLNSVKSSSSPMKQPQGPKQQSLLDFMQMISGIQ